jgi:hypothetical protein
VSWCALIALAVGGCVAETDPVGGERAAITVVEGAACLQTGECIPESTPIYAGQHIDIGVASVVSVGNELLITIDTTDGWVFDLVHVYAGLDPVPTNGAGAPAPGLFPIHSYYREPQSSATIRLPLPAACGETLNVAVHLEASHPSLGSETAWAFGTPFSRGWGWHFTYGVCCDGAEEFCTVSGDYWMSNPDAWPPHSTILTMGPERYGQDEVIALYAMDPTGDASLRLAQAWIAYKLNWYCGVPVSDADWSALLAANSAFYRGRDADGRLPYGIDPSSALGLEYIGLAQVLESFTAGDAGVPACN